MCVGHSRVLDVNSAFKTKNPKFKVGFKNMPKLMRSLIGGNGRRCERRPLTNSNTGVHNAGYSIYKIFNDRRCERHVFMKSTHI